MNTIPKTILLACCALTCGGLVADEREERLQELGELFGESSRLEAQIKANLKAIGYEI